MTVLPYIETHLTDHCNLNCRGCGHYSPLSQPRFADPTAFGRDIGRLAELFDAIGAIHLLGGEPLLHPDMLSFAQAARTAFPGSRIRLVTNGVLLPRMDSTLWSKLAQLGVRIDITRYPVRLDEAEIRRLATVHGAEVRFTEVRDRFFTIPLRRGGDADPQASFSACKELFDCAMLRDGRVYTCPVTALSPLFAERFGWPEPPTDADSFDLHAETTGEDLLAFLGAPVPRCRYCDGGSVRWFDWGVSRRAAEEWT